MTELQIELPFFHGTPFLLERTTDRQIMAIQTVSGRCFHKNEQSELMASREKTYSASC